MAEPAFRQLWIDSGRPGAHKFREILKRKGIAAPSERYLREHFLRFQSSKQLFAPPPRYTGKVWSTGIDNRWQTDIIVNTQHPSEFQGVEWSYALVVVDVFSRFAWARLIRSPLEAHVGFREILDAAGKAPSMLSTDADPGFLSAPFKELLESRGIHQIVRIGRNDLAVVDRLIFTLKRTLAQHSLETGKHDWAENLEGVVKAYNEAPHGTLKDGAPEDIRGPGGEVRDKVAFFDREEEEAHNIQTNSKQIAERAERVQRDGAFRVYRHKERLGRRVFEPSWGRDVHQVSAVDGAFVTDEHGQRHPTKEVLSIPQDSTLLAEAPLKLNPKTRGLLQRYADRLREFLVGQPDNRTTATKAHQVLSQVGDIKEAVRLAGLSQRAVIASFVGAFPDLFKLETPPSGGASHVSLR